MAAYILLVWSTAVDGQDDVYNFWYNHVHLSEVCSLPEFKDATRFAFANGDRPATDYLAIYDVETEEPETLLARLEEKSATMEMSPALDLIRIKLHLMRRLNP